MYLLLLLLMYQRLLPVRYFFGHAPLCKAVPSIHHVFTIPLRFIQTVLSAYSISVLAAFLFATLVTMRLR
jgi:hypothetical protein